MWVLFTTGHAGAIIAAGRGTAEHKVHIVLIRTLNTAKRLYLAVHVC